MSGFRRGPGFPWLLQARLYGRFAALYRGAVRVSFDWNTESGVVAPPNFTFVYTLLGSGSEPGGVSACFRLPSVEDFLDDFDSTAMIPTSALAQTAPPTDGRPETTVNVRIVETLEAVYDQDGNLTSTQTVGKILLNNTATYNATNLTINLATLNGTNLTGTITLDNLPPGEHLIQTYHLTGPSARPKVSIKETWKSLTYGQKIGKFIGICDHHLESSFDSHWNPFYGVGTAGLSMASGGSRITRILGGDSGRNGRGMAQSGLLSSRQRATLRRFDRRNMVQGKRETTRLLYLNTLKALGCHAGKPYEEVTRVDLEDFLAEAKRRYAPSTFELMKIHVKHFYRWLQGDGEGYPPLVAWVQSRTPVSRFPADCLLTRGDVLRMVSAARCQRDRALVMVLWESALRAGELLSLRVKNVSLDQYGAVVLLPPGGKTGPRRVRLIDSAPDLALWLNMHPGREDPRAPLWVSYRSLHPDAPFGYAGLQYLLFSLARRAGVRKGRRGVYPSPHLFRHSRLTDLSRGFSEAELRVIAGWTPGSRMPEVYIHLSGGDVERKMLERAGLLGPGEQAGDHGRVLTRPRDCPRCGVMSPPAHGFCRECRGPLDRS